MRKIVLLILVVVAGYMISCDKHDTLPASTVTTFFNANTSMSHNKDTVKSAGADTIVITATGGIADTLRTYGISGNLRALDSATSMTVAAINITSLAVKFDTVGMSKSNLFRWTATISLPLPAIPAKSKFKANGIFTYNANLSSQMGNQAAVDSKYVYAK